MGNRKPKPDPVPDPEPQGGYNPSKHGNFAQWFSAIVSAVAITLTLYFHYTANESKTADEHVNTLIVDKLDPAVNNINTNLDQRIGRLDQKVEELSEKVNDALGQLKRMQGTPASQTSNQLLASIKLKIENAENQKLVIPPAQLAGYKNTVRTSPQTAAEYWTTIATIINYQSFRNQMEGIAPNPSDISKPCNLLTNEGRMHSFNNTIQGAHITKCLVDLDTETFADVTFEDSVIRYHGGPTYLANIRFINCRFVLDIPVSAPASPERNLLLLALLNAPDTRAVTVPSTRSPS
jgi:hypothetical protein